MIIDLATSPKIRREPFLEYEFVADLDDSGAKILFNDPSLSYNHLVALEVGDKLLRFQLAGAQPTTTIPGDDFLVYPSIMPDVDLAYDLYAGRVKETLIINSAQAHHEFSFLLETNEVNAVLQPDNSIVYTDLEGNYLWTIEAPSAIDAKGNPVTTYMYLEDCHYVVGVIPAVNTVYPVYLDPTISVNPTNYFLWSYSDIIQTATPTPYRLVVGRNGGSQPIKTVTLYNTRSIKNTSNVRTYFYDNTSSFVKTWYQFFDKNNTAITAKLDLVVNSVNNNATITVPDGAYYLEVTGTASGTASISVTSVCKLLGLECADYTSHWDLTVKPMLYAGKAPLCKFPLTPYNSSQNSVAGSTIIEAPIGDTFVAKTYTVTYSRDINGSLSSAYCDLYNAAGTLVSSTSISAPSAPTSAGSFTTKNTTVVVPAGIVKIVLRATRVAGASASCYTTISGTFNTNLDEYGTASYAVTLTKDVTDVSISPGFYPSPPTNPIKTYVSIGSANNYVETNTFSAAAGTVVYIKVSYTGDETGTVSNQCNNIALASSPYTAVTITYDSKRSVTTNLSHVIDTDRTVVSSIIISSDTARSSVITDTLYTDAFRGVLADTEIVCDTRRLLKVLHSTSIILDSLRRITNSAKVTADSRRKLAVNQSVVSDTKRRITKATSSYGDTQRKCAKTITSTGDTKRLTLQSVLANMDTKRRVSINVYVNADTKRGIGQALQGLAILDTVRTVIKSVIAKSDLTRRTTTRCTAAVDTKRRSGAQADATSDLVRKVAKTAQLNTDTSRNVGAKTICKLDTSRKTMGAIHVLYDTKRIFGWHIALIFDTKRKVSDGVWPYVKHCELNIQVAGKRITIMSYQD